jgi:hypothetical protein
MASDCAEWFTGLRASVHAVDPFAASNGGHSPDHARGKDVPQYSWIFSIIHQLGLFEIKPGSNLLSQSHWPRGRSLAHRRSATHR